MSEKLIAAHATELMVSGHSQEAASELRAEFARLQLQGCKRKHQAKDLVKNIRNDFQLAGIDQDFQIVQSLDPCGQPNGSEVFIVTRAGLEQVASLPSKSSIVSGDVRK